MQLYITAKQLGLINGVVVLTHTHTPGSKSHSTQNWSFQRRFPKPISWLGTEKTKHKTKNRAFTNQKNYTRTQNNHKKTKLVAFCDIQPRNGAGLFSKEKICKGDE